MGKTDKDIIVKYLLGECSEEERQSIKSWIDASDDNLKEFTAMEKALKAGEDISFFYNSFDVEVELKAYIAKIDELERNQTNASRDSNKILFPVYILKVAAIVIISISIGAIATYFTVAPKVNSSPVSHQVIAPNGGKSITVLPDGTKVWLNAGTSIRYTDQYGINGRDVELTGEAYFKVTTNPQQPFTVITSELRIKAYGTAFNVKAYPDEKVISTTLEEGKVTITGKGIDIALKPRQNITYVRRKFHKNTSVKPEISNPEENKKSEVTQAEPLINSLTNIDTKLYTGWKDGKWIIESQTLAEISVLLERKFNVSVLVGSDELLNYKFRGTFTNETLEQILNVFRLTAPIDYNIDKGVVNIYLNRKRKINYMDIIK